MSDELSVGIIAAVSALLGVAISNALEAWRENQRVRIERLYGQRLRFAGERIQTSEVMSFIRLQRRRKWPWFWKWQSADLSRVDLKEVDLRHQNLQNVIFYRADLSQADFSSSNLTNCDFTGACLKNARLANADLKSCFRRS
jgi:hypothetical protein